MCMVVSVCNQVTSPIHIRPDQTAASQVCDTLSSKAAHKRERNLFRKAQYVTVGLPS